MEEPAGATLMRVAEAKGSTAREAAAAALAQVLRTKCSVKVAGLPLFGWESGRVAGTAAYHPEPSQCSMPPEFDSELQRHKASQDKLETLLDADGSQYMLDLKARLAPFNLGELPDSLKQPLTRLEWCDILLPDPHTPVETQWCALPEPKMLPKRPAANGWLSAVRQRYRSEAKRRVDAFAKKMTL